MALLLQIPAACSTSYFQKLGFRSDQAARVRDPLLPAPLRPRQRPPIKDLHLLLPTRAIERFLFQTQAVLQGLVIARRLSSLFLSSVLEHLQLALATATPALAAMLPCDSSSRIFSSSSKSRRSQSSSSKKTLTLMRVPPCAAPSLTFQSLAVDCLSPRPSLSHRLRKCLRLRCSLLFPRRLSI